MADRSPSVGSDSSLCKFEGQLCPVLSACCSLRMAHRRCHAFDFNRVPEQEGQHQQVMEATVVRAGEPHTILLQEPECR